MTIEWNVAYMKSKDGVERQRDGTEMTQTVNVAQQAQWQHAEYRRQY